MASAHPQGFVLCSTSVRNIGSKDSPAVAVVIPSVARNRHLLAADVERDEARPDGREVAHGLDGIEERRMRSFSSFRATAIISPPNAERNGLTSLTWPSLTTLLRAMSSGTKRP